MLIVTCPVFRERTPLSISVTQVTEEVRKEISFPKVELHVHLDGAVRFKTLLELSQNKNIPLGKNVEEVKKLLISHEPANLSKVLAAFDIYMPVLAGDKDAIERIAYEMCEDQAKNGVVYFEARYSPHLLCNTVNNSVATIHGHVYDAKGPLPPKAVVEAVKRGFDRGEKEFNVRARSILCCICGFTDWNKEVLQLAKEMKGYGVVAIDIAGWSNGADEQYGDDVLDVFQHAEKFGIHRTVHAGEAGEAKEVIRAVDLMKAERIGHGYRLLKNPDAYDKYAKKGRIHFEVCPYSSIMTGSVPVDWPKHPLKQMADDDVNYSINTDDPTCFDNGIMTEYQLAYKEIGLTKMQLWKASWNAANSSFAEPELKAEILRLIEKAKPTA
uniref:Adenosine deaminase n=1 Tax=Syphacia muris TaxID=451379 RepID=A0A0N5AN01_9BILA